MKYSNSIVKQFHIVLVCVLLQSPKLRQKLLPFFAGGQSLIPPVSGISGSVHRAKYEG